MILYSGTGHADVVAAAFPGEDVVTVDSTEELRDALDGGDQTVFVVDPESVDVDPIDDVLRRADRTVPTVLLTDAPEETGLDFDAVAGLDPDAEALRTAVDRARRVASYRESVEKLYDHSVEHASGEFSPDLLDTRREADQRFDELPPLDSATIGALLRDDE